MEEIFWFNAYKDSYDTFLVTPVLIKIKVD